MVARLDLYICFLRLILIYSLGLVSLIYGMSAAASNSTDVYQYKFMWGFLPVANLEIDFSEHQPGNVIVSRGETTGLSKLLKNYKARVSLQLDPAERSWDYELYGLDRGSKEIRKIRFGGRELPQLLEFKDTTAPSALKVEYALDKDSVDPLSVFSWFYTEKVLESGCNKKFKVFDGKKRFFIKIQIIEDRNLLNREHDQIISCRITMLGRSVESSKEIGDQAIVNFWPFNRKDQVIDVVIGKVEPEAFYIREIRIHSPLGKIIGRLR